MLTMFIKGYCANVVVTAKPIYLNKHFFSRLFTPRKKGYHLLLRRKSALKIIELMVNELIF